ncbi:MOSC domain containing protein [Beutenbergia cavernae DSM 12333]|uniref:MOSC domain containing protein n=1 Tax=Beutenbergia cavernae (strain ATCC BAA-8 / DSM 12333 / CCUG 43141 / JCM 11478 / NBRC 16432 / NCIMB 13614 / HKI 0122) TaxID=471853 RepID=C5BV44_BEUC1|nr:MOSC domain-containing protein [Beutenbergia cavernae]ACQ80431.1 MOSC domain containing protein [Beutenbergia cavernae DSM 12333]
MTLSPTATAVSVHSNASYSFSKPARERIRVIAGIGVEDDVHAGVTVKHRSRVRADPTRPNLRQVHLMHAELFDELAAAGFTVDPGDLGENVTTRGVDLLDLPRGTILRIGPDVVLEVTGLRNPCQQINDFAPGLLRRVVFRDDDGGTVRKAGIMTVALTGGEIAGGDAIVVELPPEPHERLEPV